MTITTKELEALADALASTYVGNQTNNAARVCFNNGIDNAIHRVADALSALEPKFDRGRWVERAQWGTAEKPNGRALLK